MLKFKEKIEKYNAKKAKRYGMANEQQECEDKIANILKKDRALKQKEIIDMMERGYPKKLILEELNNNRGLLDNIMIKKMIESGYGWFIVKNLGKLKGLDTGVAIKLIEKGLSIEVVMNLEKFKGVKFEEIANKLIKIGYPEYVANNIEKFGKLNKNIAKKLIKKGYRDIVYKYPEKF